MLLAGVSVIRDEVFRAAPSLHVVPRLRHHDGDELTYWQLT